MTTENKLVQSCLANNRQAQRQVYNKYKQPMFRLCSRYANDRMEAEDMLQVAFIKVFKGLHSWQGKGSLGAWIRTIVLRTAIEYMRKHESWKKERSLELVAELGSREVDVMSKMGMDEILALLARLPAGYRTVFNLYAIEGYKHYEIGELLNISESTSKTQYMRAKKLLREYIIENQRLPEERTDSNNTHYQG